MINSHDSNDPYISSRPYLEEKVLRHTPRYETKNSRYTSKDKVALIGATVLTAIAGGYLYNTAQNGTEAVLNNADKNNSAVVVEFSPDGEKVKAGVDGQPNTITDLLIVNSDINYPEGMEPRVAVGLAAEAFIAEHPRADGIIDRGQKFIIPSEINVTYKSDASVVEANSSNIE